MRSPVIDESTSAEADAVQKAEPALAAGQLLDELAARLPGEPRIALAAAPLADHSAALYQEEHPAVARVIAKRLREFSTGRVLARQAMGQLGLAPAPIPRRSDRAPIWPAECIGSITHAGSLGAAAVTHRKSLRGIGIDLEEDHRVTDDLHGKLFTAGERRAIDALASDSARLVRSAVLFSAKEAVYKAVNPVVGVFIGFQEVEVELTPEPDGQGGRFAMTYVGEHAPNAVMQQGRGYYCCLAAGYVCAVFLIP